MESMYNSKYISNYIKSKWITSPIKNKKTFRVDKNMSSLTLCCRQKTDRKQKDTESLKVKG